MRVCGDIGAAPATECRGHPCLPSLSAPRAAPPCPLATRSNILLRLVPVSTTSMGASVSNPNFSEPEKEPGSAGAVLIADDDPAIRLVLRHRLEADGMRVEGAGDSAAALL